MKDIINRENLPSRLDYVDHRMIELIEKLWRDRFHFSDRDISKIEKEYRL